MTAGGTGGGQVEYRDPGRGYLSTAVLAAAVVAGFLADLAIGGGHTHALAWGIVFVLVVGVDALLVYSVRLHRSVVVSAGDVRVGDARLERDRIVSYTDRPPPGTPVLGQRWGAGLPRGVRGLALHLSDGSTVLVPARHPQRLAAALRAQLHLPEIREADRGDVEAIADIERRSLALYRVAGMDIPDGYANTLGEVEPVVTLVSGRPPEGFVRLAEVDGEANIALMAVAPKRMKAGLGSVLLDAACDWALARGYRVMTVAIYADVEWAARFFAARGFTEVGEFGPELAELRDWERSVGLDALGARVVLRRGLPG